MRRKGFTLIELLVVISIIGLLSTLAVTSLNNARMKARNARRMADLRQWSKAIELYYDDHDEYPATGGYVSLSCFNGELWAQQPLDKFSPYVNLESIVDPFCSSQDYASGPYYYGATNGKGYFISNYLEPQGTYPDWITQEEKNDGGYYCALYEIIGGEGIGVEKESCN